MQKPSRGGFTREEVVMGRIEASGLISDARHVQVATIGTMSVISE